MTGEKATRRVGIPLSLEGVINKHKRSHLAPEFCTTECLAEAITDAGWQPPRRVVAPCFEPREAPMPENTPPGDSEPITHYANCEGGEACECEYTAWLEAEPALPKRLRSGVSEPLLTDEEKDAFLAMFYNAGYGDEHVFGGIEHVIAKRVGAARQQVAVDDCAHCGDLVISFDGTYWAHYRGPGSLLNRCQHTAPYGCDATPAHDGRYVAPGLRSRVFRPEAPRRCDAPRAESDTP